MPNGHPFGELLTHFRLRKPGLSQNRLAELAGYHSAILVRMGQGKKDLIGPSGRDRIVRIIGTLCDEGVALTLDEANALLAAANLPPLYEGLPVESALFQILRPPNVSLTPRHGAYLPAPPTSLVGREADVADAQRLLARDALRLLTFTGPPGVGKTRLALQAAANVEGRFANGAWFVSLAPISDPALVASAIGQALGVREVPGQAPLEAIKSHLRDKRLLLVLDNFEQVLDAAMIVAEMLASAAHLKVVITSRETLRLSGEHEFIVEPLHLSSAVDLFVQRAQAARRTFDLSDDDRPVIEQICNWLDGLPLAIELTAARVKQFSPRTLLAKLTEDKPSRLNLPTSGPRDLPARQQTLRDAIDWSYKLLPERERVLMRCLSVFSGGCTLHAAEVVCDESVADVLARLVNKSLVVVDEHDALGADNRYRLLETIREYALEKLSECGEAPALRCHHRDYFLQMAEQPWPASLEARADWLDRLECEHSNMRAAIDWSLAEAESGPALRFVWALADFWTQRHHYREAREQALKVLAQSNPAEQTLERARVLNLFAFVPFYDERHEVARSMFEEAAVIGRELGDKAFIARTLRALGFNAYHRRDLRSERSYYEEALAIWRELDDKAGIRSTTWCLGMSLAESGDHQQAQALLEEGLHLSEESGAEGEHVRHLYALGQLAVHKGDCAKAQSLFENGLRLNMVYREVVEMGWFLAAFVMVSVANGQSARAARLIGAREAMLELRGAAVADNPWSEYDRAKDAVRVQLGDGAFAAACDAGRAMTLDQAVAYALSDAKARFTSGR